MRVIDRTGASAWCNVESATHEPTQNHPNQGLSEKGPWTGCGMDAGSHAFRPKREPEWSDPNWRHSQQRLVFIKARWHWRQK